MTRTAMATSRFILFIPPYSPELNPQGNICGWLKAQCARTVRIQLSRSYLPGSRSSRSIPTTHHSRWGSESMPGCTSKRHDSTSSLVIYNTHPPSGLWAPPRLLTLTVFLGSAVSARLSLLTSTHLQSMPSFSRTNEHCSRKSSRRL